MNKERIEAVNGTATGNSVMYHGNYIVEGMIYNAVRTTEIHDIIVEIEFLSRDGLDYLYHHDELCCLFYNCTIIEHETTYSNFRILNAPYEIEYAHPLRMTIRSGNSLFAYLRYASTWYCHEEKMDD